MAGLRFIARKTAGPESVKDLSHRDKDDDTLRKTLIKW